MHVNVSKKLNNFDLRVDVEIFNELTILTGPNGSGKSTLLKLMAGLINHDSGYVARDKEILSEGRKIIVKTHNRKISYVGHSSALFPWKTVEGNINFSLSSEEIKDNEEWLTELRATLGTDELKNILIESLSEGQQKRVAIARALAKKPSMVLLDEPFSCLDKKYKQKLLELIWRIQDLWNVPVVIISHEKELMSTGDRVLNVDMGKINSDFKITKESRINYGKQ